MPRRTGCRRLTIPIALVLTVTAALFPSAGRADDVPPVIEHEKVLMATRGQPLRITATITDPDGIFEPTVYFRRSASGRFQSLPLVESGNQWTATLPAEAMAFNRLEYFIEAYDLEGNGPTQVGSDKAPLKIIVLAPEEHLVVAPEPAKAKPATEKHEKATPAPEPVLEGQASAAPAAPALSPHAARNRPALKAGPVGEGLRPLTVVGASLLGVGAAAAGAGAYFGITADRLHTMAVAEAGARAAAGHLGDARVNATRANVAFIAGGILAAGGVVLLLLPTGRHDELPFDARLLVGSSGASIALGF